MTLDRKRKTKDPCHECGLHKSLCLCHLIPTLDLKTKLVLVIHHRELKRTSNTGRLALKSLKNSEMRVRGEKGKGPLDLSDLLTPNYRTLLFFPSDEARELTPNLVNEISLPIQLIVPDGNWRQASKVSIRHPELKNVERVKISTPNTADKHIRAEHFEEGMSTLQAIAHAFAAVEGFDVGQKLNSLYQEKLTRTLRARGQL